MTMCSGHKSKGVHIFVEFSRGTQHTQRTCIGLENVSIFDPRIYIANGYSKCIYIGSENVSIL